MQPCPRGGACGHGAAHDAGRGQFAKCLSYAMGAAAGATNAGSLRLASRSAPPSLSSAGTPLDDEGRIRFVLDYLGEELEPSILIGGWATFIRVGGDISHDIDLIIGSDEIRGRVRAVLDEVSESSHLQGTKWRGEIDGVHVDIYLPFRSELGGALRLRVEELSKHTEVLEDTRWKLLSLEAHVVSKMAALLDRPSTEKGSKDAREILRLLEQGVDAYKACAILSTASSLPIELLPEKVATAFDLLVPRAGANKSQRKHIHHWKREWVSAIERQAGPTERPRPSLG